MLALGSLRAGERVPVQRPTQDDSIATAGRQLDAVKSNSASAANAAGASALPQIAVPSLQQSADSPAPAGAVVAPNDPTQRSRSANWLVDAMMKSDERKPGDRQRDSREKAGRSPDKHPSADRDDGLDHHDSPAQTTNEARGPERSETAGAASPTAATEPAFNPLARYMAGWLAPQDYALLRRTLDTSSSGTPRSTESAGGTPGPVDPTTLGGVTELFSDIGGSGKRPAGATDKPAENPYLEALTLPTAPPPAVVPDPTPMPQLAAPEPAPRPAIPPFVRPASDDRYFKPLKRF